MIVAEGVRRPDIARASGREHSRGVAGYFQPIGTERRPVRPEGPAIRAGEIVFIYGPRRDQRGEVFVYVIGNYETTGAQILRSVIAATNPDLREPAGEGSGGPACGRGFERPRFTAGYCPRARGYSLRSGRVICVDLAFDSKRDAGRYRIGRRAICIVTARDARENFSKSAGYCNLNKI